jgi:hypothetical protein
VPNALAFILYKCYYYITLSLTTKHL